MMRATRLEGTGQGGEGRGRTDIHQLDDGRQGCPRVLCSGEATLYSLEL